MHDRCKVTGPAALLAATLFTAIAASAADPRRPYEMEWAGRMADDRPPLCALTDGAGWRISGENSEATLKRATDRILFGDGVARLSYRCLGGSGKPRVFMRPPQPVSVTNDFDALSCWVFGNNVFGRDPKTPSVTIDAIFIDTQGKRFAVNLGHVHHKGWFKFYGRVPRKLQARAVQGCRFDGFCVHGGWNTAFRSLDFNSFAVFKEEWKPLNLKAPAKNLPFPVSSDTVLPPAAFEKADASLEFRLPEPGSARWDELAFRIDGGAWISLARGGGVFPDAATREASVTFVRRGNCLVADVEVPSEGLENAEVRFGAMAGLPADAVRTVFPYWTYREKARDARPAVIGWRTRRGPFFVSATPDWTRSNASMLYALSDADALNGGVRYRLRTDGRRNACRERFVWSFGRELSAILPKIPNPPSPWRHETGTRLWRQYGAIDRTRDIAYWRSLKRRGMTRVIVTDHESAWRLGEEQSYTFRTRCEPGRGGDAAQAAYARVMIDELGFLYGPYNNFVDLAPVNAYWDEDHVLRRGFDDECAMQPAWRRCWRAKPVWAAEMCGKLAPQIQRKFSFNCGYCDIHTCMRPWEGTDYDARVPGAGMFATALSAYGEIMLLQKKAWGGPVYSEGASHWFYSGLTDGNYAQDREYGLNAGPWLVDFDLRRMHPLECNAGMGMIDGSFYSAPDSRPRDRAEAVDRFLAATVAFGHSGILLPERHAFGRDYGKLAICEEEFRSYYLLQALAARYTQANVDSIRYASSEGRFLSTEEALLSADGVRSQIAVRYADGTETVVNGSTNTMLSCAWRGGRLVLPPNGFVGITGDGRVFVWLGEKDGHRAEFCLSPDYVYMNGRGTFTRLPGGGTDGICVRRLIDAGTEEVIPFNATQIELPYAAERIEILDEAGGVAETVVPHVKEGRTRLEPKLGVVSYRVTRKASFPGISSKDILEAMLK